MAFHDDLTQALLQRGWTRATLARKLGGPTLDTIRAWLSGTRLPGLVYRHKLQELMPELGDIPQTERPIRPAQERKEVTTVYLEPGTLARLRALAEKEQRPVASLIRRAIAEHLQLADLVCELETRRAKKGEP